MSCGASGWISGTATAKVAFGRVKPAEVRRSHKRTRGSPQKSPHKQLCWNHLAINFDLNIFARRRREACWDSSTVIAFAEWRTASRISWLVQGDVPEEFLRGDPLPSAWEVIGELPDSTMISIAWNIPIPGKHGHGWTEDGRSQRAEATSERAAAGPGGRGPHNLLPLRMRV